MSPFHFAFNVLDIKSTRDFYVGILECKEGRSTEHWIDFDFFGNQLSAHVTQEVIAPSFSGKVDGIPVPMPHFGCILVDADFSRLQNRLITAGVNFIIKPMTRYQGETGEQKIMFVQDFSGNAIEFKAFKNVAEVFAR